MKTNPFAVLAEKVLWTYLQALVVLLTVGTTIHVGITTELAIAALPAALTVLANSLPAVPGNLPFAVDLGFRMVRTGVATFLGFLLSQPVFHLTASVGRAAGLAAFAAVLAVVKGALASKIGLPTPALLPAAVDVPPAAAPAAQPQAPPVVGPDAPVAS